MLSLATTVFASVSNILASYSSASTAAATKLSSQAFASLDQLTLNHAAPLLVYSVLLSVACYFAFNSLAVMKDILKEPIESQAKHEEDVEEIELSSIDAIAQSKPESKDTISASDINKTESGSSTALVVYQPPIVKHRRSRRNSIKCRPKGPGDFGYVNLAFTLTGPDNNTVVHLNHERITLIDDKNEEVVTDSVLSEEPQAEKKPFEYYLCWDLPTFELEQLSYSEKYRRFFLLSKYGEVKQEAKPLAQDQIKVKGEAKPPEKVQVDVKALPPEPVKPMNLISDLVHQADLIDIPTFQVQLMKLNHQLTQSYLSQTEQRKFCFSPANMLRGRFDLSKRLQLKQFAVVLKFDFKHQ